LLDVLIATIDQQQRRKYKRLLVPTHFSTTANHAVRRGLELARQHEASLTLLHVRQRLSSKLSTDIDHASAELVTRLDTEDEDDAMARLAALVPSYLASVRCETVGGDLVMAIIKAATRHQTDLIIMGHSKRRSSWSLFGSNVSRQVVRRAPCPVLVVTEPTRYELVGR
jgi:universal stress protein A